MIDPLDDCAVFVPYRIHTTQTTHTQDELVYIYIYMKRNNREGCEILMMLDRCCRSGSPVQWSVTTLSRQSQSQDQRLIMSDD